MWLRPSPQSVAGYSTSSFCFPRRAPLVFADDLVPRALRRDAPWAPPRSRCPAFHRAWGVSCRATAQPAAKRGEAGPGARCRSLDKRADKCSSFTTATSPRASRDCSAIRCLASCNRSRRWWVNPRSAQGQIRPSWQLQLCPLMSARAAESVRHNEPSRCTIRWTHAPQQMTCPGCNDLVAISS